MTRYAAYDPRYACCPRRYLRFAVTPICLTHARTRVEGAVHFGAALSCEGLHRNRVNHVTAVSAGVTPSVMRETHLTSSTRKEEVGKKDRLSDTSGPAE